MAENIINFDINTRSATGDMQEISQAVGGLEKTVRSLGVAVQSVFAGAKISEYMGKAVSSSGDLEKELLVLRLGLGKLKAAIGQAVAPLGVAFIPVVQQAVWATTRLVKSVGKVIGALFGGSEASEDFGDNTLEAAKSQQVLEKSAAKAKRTLAGFDEINRLGSSSGGSAGTEILSEGKVPDTLSPQLQRIVDKILSLTAPLKEIDFAPAVAAFGKLREAITPLGQTLFSGLEWAWHNLLVPLAAWSIEDLLPAFLQLLSGALQVLNGVLVALRPVADWLWEKFLKPVAQWTGETAVKGIQWLTERLQGLSHWIGENQGLVQGLVVLVGGLAAAWALVNGAASKWNVLGVAAAAAVGALITVVALLAANWDKVKNTALQVWESVKNIWGNAAAWFRGNVLNPLATGFRSTANGVIGVVNGMIAGAVRGLNSLIKAINALQFSIPAWVPGLGGKTLGFNMKPVTAPSIPYLAKGAVLPANRPFMAVVGDQRHGTNIEAPLATIQEAVALVMNDQTAAILAGFESSVGVQREILQAVLGIQIGDDVIGQAVTRYQRRLAAVKGG